MKILSSQVNKKLVALFSFNTKKIVDFPEKRIAIKEILMLKFLIYLFDYFKSRGVVVDAKISIACFSKTWPNNIQFAV